MPSRFRVVLLRLKVPTTRGKNAWDMLFLESLTDTETFSDRAFTRWFPGGMKLCLLVPLLLLSREMLVGAMVVTLLAFGIRAELLK